MNPCVLTVLGHDMFCKVDIVEQYTLNPDTSRRSIVYNSMYSGAGLNKFGIGIGIAYPELQPPA